MQAQIILLSDAMVEMLRVTPRVPESPWLIPSTLDPQKQKFDLIRDWVKLCKVAKIEGAVIHDLRRTFGAKIARTAGLHVASRLLRHSDIRVTESIYAPIDETRLREALRSEKSEAQQKAIDARVDIARIGRIITKAKVVETIIQEINLPRSKAQKCIDLVIRAIVEASG